MKDRKYAWSSCNVVFCGIKMFYEKILDRDTSSVIPPRPRQKQLPIVLSQKEVLKLIDSCKNLKHRTLLLCAYSAGLRVSEIVALQPVHIESNRMMIRIDQGKGRKDRYTILSEHFLSELKMYWRKYRPEKYLFFGADKAKPMAIGTAQKIYYQAKKRAGITRGRGIHTLRHCFATHLMEQGVQIYVIKKMMGHVSLSTTAGYIHVSNELLSTIQSPLDRFEQISHENDIRRIQ
jgi:site-specific recombinase XerD